MYAKKLFVINGRNNYSSANCSLHDFFANVLCVAADRASRESKGKASPISCIYTASDAQVLYMEPLACLSQHRLEVSLVARRLHPLLVLGSGSARVRARDGCLLVARTLLPSSVRPRGEWVGAVELPRRHSSHRRGG